MSQEKESRVINKFQSLLRSGMDFDVNSMYKEAGETVCVAVERARQIVNRYYRGIVSQDMIDFVSGLNCSHPEKVKLFAVKFRICERESRLIIRYIKRKR